MTTASFWEQDAMLDADFAVVGGGLTGLQTALELRKRRAGCPAAVLKRGWAIWHASQQSVF